MASCVRYLTHPQVDMDRAVPVPKWQLSEVGRARAQRFATSICLKQTAHIVSSAERKALQTAELIGGVLGLAVEVRAAMHENDRSATGFLPPAEFEAAADAFFAYPNRSFRGWEKAIDAQARIVREMEAILAEPHGGDVLFVGHGAVGTLLYCHLTGSPIDRRYDQPAGGGQIFAFNSHDRNVAHPWRSIEDLT